MKFVQAIFALVLMAVLPGQAFVQSIGSSKVLLVETGDGFHGGEVKARNGETWLGLYVTKQGSFLADSKVTVRRVIDVVVDEDPARPTGKSVSVDRRPNPVFLVKNAEMLKPGAVSTAYRRSEARRQSLKVGTPLRLKLGEQNYQLKVVSQRPRPKSCESCLPVDARLLLNIGASTQVIFDLGAHLKKVWGQEMPSEDEIEMPEWSLLWAGDVDADGKLDLYLGVTGENMEEHLLLLSSAARPKQLVREIARFTITGC
ncbi:MAG TPA: hypothetical protein PLD20_08405 [Blastocatellia bacterium]|nr:hypothetical protein [Blastocatellia bacterium]HMV84117.1 hypothetical protein [Blastocatellia bacterium]HMX30236.1 hypothetical protein [Blastocatellia bacterium]HMY71245.1 hypothetical protein [Blastocatellia bacterium]HMZ17936.1 hypothetical protein [Blastocatellia bacterium]